MKIIAKNVLVAKQTEACLIIGLFEDGLTSTAVEIDKLTQRMISKIIKQSHFEAKIGQTLPAFAAHERYSQLLLVGLGKKQALTRAQFRQVTASSINAIINHHCTYAVSYLPDIEVENATLAWKVQQTALIAWDALYLFDQFKTKKYPTYLKELMIQVNDNKQLKKCEKMLEQAKAIAEGIKFTKDLANLPSNICTPSYLANESKKLASSFTAIKTQVLDEKAMQKLGMGALLGVAKGSQEEAKLICVTYTGTSKQAAPVALVGKGVTFDTGGISLKPADAMVGMKYDMCGAATVLGTIKAAASLKLAVNIVGVIPATENMPDGGAYKPEDILTSLSGQTIEVLNTDAEGRLILSDALTYCERFKPDVVIDIATLTGAVVIALGTHATGLLTNYQPLADDLLKAGEEMYDRAWQLPMFEEYQEQIKSPFADMANVGGRAAGTITAACFLSRFTNKFHWAHLDVAGTAAVMSGNLERKATGRPVPLLMQYLINRSEPNHK